MKQQDKPLVSVIVVTYNSSDFIIETLDSVKDQSYQNIELIITDDASKDDTAEKCEQWISKYGERFSRTRLITSEKNTGVSANANRGLAEAQGDWLSFPAGDDALYDNCISDNMQWIRENGEDIGVLFSRVGIFMDTFDEKNLVSITPELPFSPQDIMSPGRSALSQYKMLLLLDRIHYTPSAFFNKSTLLEIGGFDERFKYLEDYPLWLSLTGNGHRLQFMDHLTVKYRQHSRALKNSGNLWIIHPSYFHTGDFRKIYIFPNLPWLIRKYRKFDWHVRQVFRLKFLNRNKKINRAIFTLLTAVLNPYRYMIFIRKRMNKKFREDEFYQ